MSRPPTHNFGASSGSSPTWDAKTVMETGNYRKTPLTGLISYLSNTEGTGFWKETFRDGSYRSGPYRGFPFESIGRDPENVHWLVEYPGSGFSTAPNMQGTWGQNPRPTVYRPPPPDPNATYKSCKPCIEAGRGTGNLAAIPAIVMVSGEERSLNLATLSSIMQVELGSNTSEEVSEHNHPLLLIAKGKASRVLS